MMMFVVKSLLWLAALWQAVSVITLANTNYRRVQVSALDTTLGGVKFGLACIGFILALGFLGVLLK